MKKFLVGLFFTTLSLSLFSQGWELNLKSNVEIRSWKLTTKAEESLKPLAGASIKLMKGGTLVKQTTSDGNGDFDLKVPPNGEFILEVSYLGCTTKRALINTMNVPDPGEEIFKPSFGIGGFILSKPFSGIDYSGLQQPLVKVAYKESVKNFDDDETYTQQGLGTVSKIAGAEKILIDQFCSTNKAGDEALKKPDCPLAKTLYEKAIKIIAGESYPVEQLAKVAECLAAKEQAEQKAKEDAAKAEAEKLAKQKAEEEKALKAKEEAAKAAAEKLAKEAELKAQKQQELAAKADADKLAKQKEEEQKNQKAKDAAAKAEADKLVNQKAEEEKTQKAKEAAAKAEADKLAKTAKDAELKAQKEKELAAKAEKEKPAKNQTPAQAEPPKITTTTTSPKENKNKSGITIISTGTPNESNTKTKSGSKHSTVRHELGSDKYNTAIQKGDNCMANKKYPEAKAAFQEALKLKPKDLYASERLKELEKLMK
jgi:hypothetical protein